MDIKYGGGRTTMKARKYDMGTRAVTKSATRETILTACIDTFNAERSFSVTLAAVADRAGVTVKTLLRHFGSREALIDAAWSHAYEDSVAERTPPPGHPEEALALLIAHYERRGDMSLAILAQEKDDPRAQRMGDWGRLAHRAWVEDVFGSGLPEQPEQRSRVLDVLVVATDVYAWKLLRIDRGLAVDDVRDRMRLMTEAILAISPHEPKRAESA